MPLPSVYTQVYGQIPEFFSKLQEGQAPTTFTQQHLKDIGFPSSNHRAFIPLLKALGFLTPGGAPTERYHAYRDKSQSRIILGAAMKEAYGDLFVIKTHPAEKDRPLIEGKFKSVHNASDRTAELMARTFFALLKIAELEQTNAPTPPAPAPPPSAQYDPPAQQASMIGINGMGATSTPPPGLHYNIQIHLPATKDVEVYNAIFKSLREHLVG